jgi:hypothetical protein
LLGKKPVYDQNTAGGLYGQAEKDTTPFSG